MDVSGTARPPAMETKRSENCHCCRSVTTQAGHMTRESPPRHVLRQTEPPTVNSALVYHSVLVSGLATDFVKTAERAHTKLKQQNVLIPKSQSQLGVQAQKSMAGARVLRDLMRASLCHDQAQASMMRAAFDPEGFSYPSPRRTDHPCGRQDTQT